MVVRLKKIYKQFLLVVGLFMFLVISFHLMPAYFEAQNNLLLALDKRNFDNHSIPRATKAAKPRKINIWKDLPGEDRIVAQLAFKPYVDTSLPQKTIYVENGAFGWGVSDKDRVFKEQNCQVQHCSIVDRPEEGVLYDARMFKEIDLNKYVYKSQLSTTHRHDDQVWIMFALESPLASPDYEELNNVINWTATYRPDSTIVTPYEKWVPFDNFTGINAIIPERNYARGKTKMGAIFVSNCPTPNDRLKYIQELKKYIDVDVYGACGDLQCDKGSQRSCYDMLNNDYKFYFAFENANCRYYITEKFFMNALLNNVVPVVMGAHPNDYQRAAPPGSYIHVNDFKTPEDLANYLKKLDSDDEEYNKYFRWQSTGSFINTKFWCRICAMLWSPDRPHMSVPDLEEWWRGDNTCIGSRQWSEVTVN